MLDKRLCVFIQKLTPLTLNDQYWAPDHLFKKLYTSALHRNKIHVTNVSLGGEAAPKTGGIKIIESKNSGVIANTTCDAQLLICAYFTQLIIFSLIFGSFG